MLYSVHIVMAGYLFKVQTEGIVQIVFMICVNAGPDLPVRLLFIAPGCFQRFQELLFFPTLCSPWPVVKLFYSSKHVALLSFHQILV